MAELLAARLTRRRSMIMKMRHTRSQSKSPIRRANTRALPATLSGRMRVRAARVVVSRLHQLRRTHLEGVSPEAVGFHKRVCISPMMSTQHDRKMTTQNASIGLSGSPSLRQRRGSGSSHQDETMASFGCLRPCHLPKLSCISPGLDQLVQLCRASNSRGRRLGRWRQCKRKSLRGIAYDTERK